LTDCSFENGFQILNDHLTCVAGNT
jgi:hypothetical protein